MKYITFVLLSFILAGCANRHIPTGKYENHFAESTTPQFSVASLSKGAFDADTGQLEIFFERHVLEDEFRLPVILTAKGQDLYWGMKEPLGNYRWESAKNLAVDADLLISTPSKELRLAKQRTKNGLLHLNLTNFLIDLKPDESIKITCSNCSPFGLKPQDPQGRAIEGPPLAITVDFGLSQEDYRQAKKLALSRVKEDEARRRAVAAREKRESMERQIAFEKEQARIAREGDGSEDDRSCQQYGFKPSTPSYADCRLKVDIARKQQAQMDALRQQQEAFRQQQQAQYQAQLEEERQRESNRAFNEALANFGRALSAPPAPAYTPPHTYTLPSGKMMTCTTTGTMTNCF